MRDRASFQRHSDHVSLAVLDGLFDRRRHFVGLAIAAADSTAAIADDDHAIEAETTATFDHRGTAADFDDLFDQIAAAFRFAAAPIVAAAASRIATLFGLAVT